jgi:predicted acetyltransferase
MEISQTSSSRSVEVVPASQEQEPIVANLIELYAHDFSEFIDLKLGANGRFGYQHLSSYWKEPNRYPFLVMVDGLWAGFVFVRRESQISGDQNIWDMTEFFIVRGYRRLGIGREVAHQVWRKLPGAWEVRVINRNKKAVEFWRRAISEYIGEGIDPISYNKNGEGWHVFTWLHG